MSAVRVIGRQGMTIDPEDFAHTARGWFESGDHGDPLSVIELVHAGSPHPAKSWKVTDGKTSAGDVDQTIRAILARAQRDSDAWKGEPQTYQFLAYFGGSDRPSETYSASFTGKRHSPTHAGSTLDPSYEGALALMMRHAADSAADARAANAMLLEGQRAMLDELSAMRQERAEVWELLQDVTQAKDAKEERAKKDKQDSERFDKLLGVCGVLFPSAANKIMGEKIFPEVTSPLIEQFRSAFGLMESHHVDKLAGVFTDKPEVMIALTDLFGSFLDDKEKREALAKLIAKTDNARPSIAQKSST